MLACVALSTHGQQAPEGEETLPQIQSWLVGAVSQQVAAFDTLNDNYKKALERLLEAQSAASNLNGAVRVRGEIEAFGDGKDFDEAVFRNRLGNDLPALKTLQTTYLNERTRITANLLAPLAAATREYDRRLNALQDRLTKALLIDDALLVSKLREELKQNPNAAVAKALREEAVNPQIAATAGDVMRGRGRPGLSGRIALVIKGDAEMFHNREKVEVEKVSDDTNHICRKSDLRTFRAGDVVVLKARSPWATRSLTLAIQAADNAFEVAVKEKHWRLLGMDLDPNEVTADTVRSSKQTIPGGKVDESVEALRVLMEMRSIGRGGSEWIFLPEIRSSHTIGFVLTDDMLRR